MLRRMYCCSTYRCYTAALLLCCITTSRASRIVPSSLTMADYPDVNTPAEAQQGGRIAVAHGDVDAVAAAGIEDGTIHMDVDGDGEHFHHLQQQQHDNVSTLGDEWFDLQDNSSTENHHLQVGGWSSMFLDGLACARPLVCRCHKHHVYFSVSCVRCVDVCEASVDEYNCSVQTAIPSPITGTTMRSLTLCLSVACSTLFYCVELWQKS